VNTIKCAVVACLVSLGATLPAQAFHVIYQVLGVFDSGDVDNTGIATSFHCSNPTNNNVTVRVRVRGPNGVLVAVNTHDLPGLTTFTWSTHATFMFSDEDTAAILGTGAVRQGTAQIMTETSDLVLCAADLLDASSTQTFVAPRRMIRFPRSTSGGED
jgi:hypothetical protein